LSKLSLGTSLTVHTNAQVDMVDPITALDVLDKVACLAGTLSKVFRALYDYGHSVKEAPEKSQQLQEELFSLSNQSM
jgi:hypothetical protein